jgi:hypothetical protein
MQRQYYGGLVLVFKGFVVDDSGIVALAWRRRRGWAKKRCCMTLLPHPDGSILSAYSELGKSKGEKKSTTKLQT